MPEKYVRQAGLPILVRHTGPSTLPETPPVRASGRAVVCLHDAGLQSSIFSDLLGALRSLRTLRFGGVGGGGHEPRGPDACALAFDLPGHGRSGGLDALPSIEAMSECARGVADWCRATRPILVGHGMGALVALDWARQTPESIAGLVLCGTSAAFGVADDAIATMREVTLGRAARPFDPKRLAPGGSPDLMRRAWFESIQTDPRVTLVDLEASRAFASSLTDAPAVPTLVVCGEHEAAAERESAQALATRLGARLHTIPSAAHWLPLEQPAAFAAEILRLPEAA